MVCKFEIYGCIRHGIMIFFPKYVLYEYAVLLRNHFNPTISKYLICYNLHDDILIRIV